MADSNPPAESWTLTVRLSSGERFTVTLPGSSKVLDCKNLIASIKSELEASRQRLVYKGRILEDDERHLSDYGIVDQATLFLVMSSGATGAPVPPAAPMPSAPSPSTANPPANPFAFPGAGASMGANPFGANGPPNPEQMNQMMNSPMMQNLMENPQMMQTAMNMTLQTNPQLRQILDSNPELRQVWNDPAMMQQAMQMMRNPEMMQQAMRQQELAMSQLENLPGGFSALSSMYRNIQEPLLEAQDAAPDSTPSNASQANSNEGATGAAMPNPWGAPSATTTTPTTPSPRNAGTNTTPTAMPNPWGMPSSTTATPAPANNPWGTGAAAAPTPPGGAMPGFPMMPGQQPNMEQMSQVLDNPMMMQMMQQMVDQNPDMIRQMLEAQNPMMRQMFNNNPEMGNQFVRQMMNPQALRSMMQMQQAMSGGAPPQPNTGTQPANPSLDFSNLLGGAGAPANSGATPAPPPMDFSQFMQQMQLGGSPAMGFQQQQQQHPADRFRVQLQSLRDMGFDDEQACLSALQQNHGNLNRAVDHLLMGPPSAPAAAPPTAPAPVAASRPEPTQNDSQEPPPEPKDAQDKKND